MGEIMKLTELRDKIKEALKLHEDYDVFIKIDDEEIKPHIDDCNISSSRYSFLIRIKNECDIYHIEDMKYCNVCDIYYPNHIECPSCRLKEEEVERNGLKI